MRDKHTGENMSEREYGCAGAKYRINDRGAVVNPDRVKIIAGGGKIELRYAQTLAGEWYGAWSVYAVGFGDGRAVFLPARVCMEEYGVVVEPVDWVEDRSTNTPGETREKLLFMLRARVMAWLESEREKKSWYGGKLARMIEALQNPDLSEEREIVYERVRVERKEVVPKEGLQMSLF
jgi:hypothetical protein